MEEKSVSNLGASDLGERIEVRLPSEPMNIVSGKVVCVDHRAQTIPGKAPSPKDPKVTVVTLWLSPNNELELRLDSEAVFYVDLPRS
jgi:hypothetical protein